MSIREDPKLGKHSDLKQRNDDSEDALNTVDMLMKVIGAMVLGISLLILANIVCLVTLMCGPNSSFVKYFPLMEPLRDDLEDEVIDMKDEDELIEYYSKHISSKMSSKAMERMTDALERRKRRVQVSERHKTRKGKGGERRHGRPRSSSPPLLQDKDAVSQLASLKSASCESPDKEAAATAAAEGRKDRKLKEVTGKDVPSDRGRRRPRKEASPRRAGRSASPSAPSASPDRDAKKYRREIKEIAPHAGRDTSSSPSASPDKDRKRYDRKISELLPSLPASAGSSKN